MIEVRDYYKGRVGRWGGSFSHMINSHKLKSAWICSKPEGERGHTSRANAIESFNWHIDKYCKKHTLGFKTEPELFVGAEDGVDYYCISSKVELSDVNTVDKLPLGFGVDE